ncbi:MAG: hypothetical protein L0211_05560 [Planctomycetaceae bacterium]|nr:hypothetical protein [Planctomycetaceae bacterium]
MFTGPEIVATLSELGVTHVVWVPDTAIGPWEAALDAAGSLRLIRVCREGEAWPLAAGLHLGGKSPLVMMQTTGLFESGDALRNVLFDLKLPIFSLIGLRNWLTRDRTTRPRLMPSRSCGRGAWNASGSCGRTTSQNSPRTFAAAAARACPAWRFWRRARHDASRRRSSLG